jgi:4-hydroxybutyryl-CoA dehydratase/vinylacetyl-CoA-Delta-isomerase
MAVSSNAKNKLMTGEEYRQSLRARKPLTVYFNGERIENLLEHPIIRLSINSVAATYDLAHKQEYKNLATAKSALTGNIVNRFCHLHQSTQDLMDKVNFQRLLGQKTGACFQRCVGMDSINAVFIVTYEIDKKYNTDYHQRFKNYMLKVEQNDWTIDGCMTDVKGDRKKRPSEQTDPDLYVRVVERRKDGVVIRGAKAHQTGAINSHEHLLMPTVAMRQEDKDYAICCAVAVDAPGITYLYGRQASDMRKMDTSECGKIDCGNACFGGQECLIVFDNVFVPNEQVFMDGEYDLTGLLVETFSAYHRQSYGGCKTGVGDVMIGAAACAAEYNGVDKASHVKDKIVEMNHLNETMYACGIACSANGRKTGSGVYAVDTLLANVCKQNVTRFPYEIARLLQDIAGGLMVTLPSAKDWSNPEIKGYVEKYLAAADGVSVENRIKMFRLIENLTLGSAAVGYLVESLHGAGSPQAQRIMIGRLSDIETKKRYAKDLASIKE